MESTAAKVASLQVANTTNKHLCCVCALQLAVGTFDFTLKQLQLLGFSNLSQLFRQQLVVLVLIKQLTTVYFSESDFFVLLSPSYNG